MSMPSVPNDYPVELTAPDITPWRAPTATGIDYTHKFDSGVAGPHVMVSAVVHGNELCGAIVLDWLLREQVRPVRGVLTLAFMNVAAFQSFDRDDPTASRYVDEDFNRVWGEDVLDGPRDSVELRRAREVRPLLDDVDLLLDVHSMQHLTAPLMMAGPAKKGVELSRAVGVPRTIVVDAGHAAGKRMRDYAGFADAASPRNALLVECGQHWEHASVDVAKQSVLRFLSHAGVLAPAFLSAHLAPDTPPAQAVVEVSGPYTVRKEGFRFTEDYRGLEVIAAAGTVIGYDGATEVTTPHDDCVLIMPSRRLFPGQSAVRFGRIVG